MRLVLSVGLVALLAPAPAEAGGQRWDGVYLGVGVLGNRATASHNGPGVGLPQARGHGGSVIVGRSWQRGAVVAGAELAVSRGNLHGQGGCGAAHQRCHVQDTHYASARVRVGVAQGRALGFLTLGVAQNRWEQRIGPQWATVRDRGLVIGVGGELALRPGLALRVDAERMRMGRSQRLDGGTGRLRTDTLRLSVVGRY